MKLPSLAGIRDQALTEFDGKWYADQYADVGLLGLNPEQHYIWLGRRLGRLPVSPRKDIVSVAKVNQVGRIINDDAAKKIEALAKSSLLDPEYVCKQLGTEGFGNYHTATLYYDNIESRHLKPNPLFDPQYYKYANKLPYHVDAVEHYLATGANAHLACHRLFDGEWYKSQDSSAGNSDDLVDHYWRFGYKNKIFPVNPEKVEILPEVASLFFGDKQEDICNVDIYRSFNDDLFNFSDEDLIDHYEKFGRSEKRIANAKDFFHITNSNPRFLPIDFVGYKYSDLYVDLSEVIGKDLYRSMHHYLKWGIVENRNYSIDDLLGYFCDLNKKYSYTSIKNIDKIPACVLIHMYYTDMWGDIEKYLENIDVEFDICINFVDSTWDLEVINRIRGKYPSAKITISENSGHDIGGYFRMIDTLDLEMYLSVITVHSKKSPQNGDILVRSWKDNLLSAIMGSKEIFEQNISALAEDSSIGIIGSAKHRHTLIAGNRELYNHLLKTFEIGEEHVECEYVSGTMMMMRSDIMITVYEKLKGFDFVNADGKELDFHVDGQAEHAIERIFGNVMKEMGYRFLWR